VLRATVGVVEIRLTHHARERAAQSGIATELVHRCCVDPDRVRGKRLSGIDRVGLACTRDFEQGTMEAITVQRGMVMVVITVYWLVSSATPTPARRRAK